MASRLGRVRVSRTIVYEGTPEWVAMTLANSFIQPGKVFTAGGDPSWPNSITFNHQEETVIRTSEEPAVEIKEVPYGA